MEIVFFSNDADEVKRFATVYPAEVWEADIRMEQWDCDVIVSPANSACELQGGIDIVYYYAFGGENLQKYVWRRLRDEYAGELLVGHHMIVDLRNVPGVRYNPGWPKYFILCPTMAYPMNVSKTRNAYLFCYALLDALRKIPDVVRVRVPLPCVGTGKMSPEQSAKQCKDAIEARSWNGPVSLIYVQAKDVLRRMRRLVIDQESTA